MPTPPTIASGLTPQKLDDLIARAEASATDIGSSRSSEAELVEAELTLLARLGALHDGICAILREHHLGKPALIKIFGDGGGRIARIRTMLDRSALFSEANASDVRWRNCMDLCEKVESVLASLDPRDRDQFSHGGPASSSSGGTTPRGPTPGGLSMPPPPPVPGLGAASSSSGPLSLVTPRSEQPTPRGGMFLREPSKEAVADSSLVDLGLAKAPIKEDDDDAEDDVQKLPREPRPELTFKSGAKYTGEWVGNQRDGEGVQVWPNGSAYMGQFVRGGVHGKGVYTQKDGLIYAGQWKWGRPHGNSTETFPDGTMYEGQYRDGTKSGLGTYYFAEGSIYEGEFLDNKIHGEGVYIWADGNNGRKYSGQWRSNRMHGRGLFTFADGRRYEGEYICDRKNGAGTFSWPDGRAHKGQWRQGRQHGLGVYTDLNGRRRKGEWEDGRLVRWSTEEPEAVIEHQPDSRDPHRALPVEDPEPAAPPRPQGEEEGEEEEEEEEQEEEEQQRGDRMGPDGQISFL